MLTTMRKVLCVDKTVATSDLKAGVEKARDVDVDAPSVASPTRQRTRTRTTSLKGLATCRPQACTVTVIATTHALTAAASIQRTHPTAVPIFFPTHTTTEGNELAFTKCPETVGATRPTDATAGRVSHTETQAARNIDASEHADEASERLSVPPCEEAIAIPEPRWYNTDDANAQIPQKWETCENTAMMPTETIELLDALYLERYTVVWDDKVAGLPRIALSAADGTGDDFAALYSNQPNPQWAGDYLHVPLPVFASTSFGPTEPPSKFWDPPVTVFSPSRFAASVQLSSTHAPYQALFAQKHAYKAAAYIACLAGASLRSYYDDHTIIKNLDKLYVFTWTDPAAPLLELWRHYAMITIYESDHPFRGVPHIVVSGTHPTTPWDSEAALVPEQDERFLTVPIWVYQQELEEEPEEHVDDDGYAAESEQAWSESEPESEEARTPSPPSWPALAFRRSAPGLADVFEEDEDASDMPSVTEARFRHMWLDDDDDESVYPGPSSYALPPSLPHPLSMRLTFRATLPDIGETSPEEAYRPLAADYKPLWTRDARLPATSSDSDEGQDLDSESLYTDARERLDDSETDQSQYVDAAETDIEPSEDDYGYRARDVPRPSCDIFLNDGDESDIPPAPASLTRNIDIPARKFDWSDSLDSDSLGSPSFEDDT